MKVLIIAALLLTACGPSAHDVWIGHLNRHGETLFCLTADDDPPQRVVGARIIHDMTWGVEASCITIIQDGAAVAKACGLKVVVAPCPDGGKS